MYKLKIKEASLVDVMHFVSLGRSMHREGVYSFVDYDEVIAMKTARDYIISPDCCAYLIFRGEEAIGMHMASLTTYFFSPAKLAASLVIYVKFDHRGSRAALMLMNAFLDWAKLKDADEMYIGVSAGIKLETGDRFFKHFGFEYVGGNYKKRFERVKHSGGLHL